jgi:hypothetical protein
VNGERGEERERERRGKKICNNNEINKTFSNHPFFFLSFQTKTPRGGCGVKNNRECARVVWCGEGDNGEKNNPKLTP